MSEKMMERVAVTGSPNTIGTISVDVLQEAMEKPLNGAMLVFETRANGRNGIIDYSVITQVNEVTTKNLYHQDSAFKNVIKIDGYLPRLTEMNNTVEAKAGIIGAYIKDINGKYHKSNLAIPPRAGLSMHRIDNEFIENIMEQEVSYSYIGEFYGADCKAPISVKHFGPVSYGGDASGIGEGRMGGVFGETGSGKTAIACNIGAGWSQNIDMGMLFLDPQSEFSDNKVAGGTSYSYDFHHVLRVMSKGRFSPERDIIKLKDIAIQDYSMFAKLLKKSGLIQKIGASSAEKQVIASGIIAEALVDFRKKNKDKSCFDNGPTWEACQKMADSDGSKYTSFEEILADLCSQAYTGPNRQNQYNIFLGIINDSVDKLIETWDSVAVKFSLKDKYNLEEDILLPVMHEGRIVILNLDEKQLAGEEDVTISRMIMHYVIQKIRKIANGSYKGRFSKYYSKLKGDGGCNCLIVMDEAARYIPQSPDEDQRDLTLSIIQSVQEFRKYRCGFMFIAQRIADISKRIYSQLHFRVYAYGLTIGADKENFIDREREGSYELYSTLPSPQLSGEYSYMIAGSLVAIGTVGMPMLITGFKSDTDFIAANNKTAIKRKTVPSIESTPVFKDSDNSNKIGVLKIFGLGNTVSSNS